MSRSRFAFISVCSVRFVGRPERCSAMEIR